MSWRRLLPDSLTGRIPIVLVGVQVGCIVLAMLAFPLIAPFTSYERIADTSVRRLLDLSLRQDAGGLRIEPTPDLVRYAQARPGLSYAALRANPGGSAPTIAAGSAPGLAALLTRLSPALPQPGGGFDTTLPGPGGGTVFVTTQATALGDVTFATARNVFHLEDVPSLVDEFLPAILPAYGPILIGVLIILPVVIRHMLRVLREVAAAAARIDLRTLDRRLPVSGLPSELRSVVAAMNGALDRLADTWNRQLLFTANAAHELRTPVAVLQARIDAMAADAPDRAALARDARRLRLLVDQLLAVARLDHRGSPLDLPVELIAAVRALVADCAPLALRSGKTIAFHAMASSVTVRGDVRAIEGAVANLIDNALRAEPEGGTVDVVVDGEEGGCIEVRDHGAGVAPEHRTLVFEPFWRKDDRSSGTGLGLAAVREVTRLHGGTADISETPGGGATFRITLPLAASEGADRGDGTTLRSAPETAVAARSSA